MSLSTATSTSPSLKATDETVVAKKRIASIDIMRGLVIVLMLVDHVREKFFYHMRVPDPLDLDNTSVDLFFTRISAHLCAPAFVFLTGLSAWLYAHPTKGGYRSPSSFLFKRGLFLILIEVTLINFSWMGNYDTLWLQVIWAIGLSMIALSLLVKLPVAAIAALGFLIVFGHNLLTPISFSPGEFGYTLWTILHDRGYLVEGGLFDVWVSYPVLPWIGVILLGFTAGPLYSRAAQALSRKKTLMLMGISSLALLILLRGFNIYGETLPWVVGENAVQTIMSFINFTKYPPSLDFLLMTLGVTFLLLAWFEHCDNWFTDALEVFGSAPMFFYIVHLYLLLVIYEVVLSIWGPNYGDFYSFPDYWWVWVASIVLTLVLYYPTKMFAAFKHSTDKTWVKYF